MLKPCLNRNNSNKNPQPPSGGCVLKQQMLGVFRCVQIAAAFRRLCVETELAWLAIARREAAAFRRLCVETLALNLPPEGALRSRLQAAVC